MQKFFVSSVAWIVASYCLLTTASAEMLYTASATAIPFSDFQSNSPSPVSVSVINGPASAMAESNTYAINGSTIGGSVVSSYMENINFLERFGINVGSGPVTVVASYSMSAVAGAGNMGVSLRLTSPGLGGSIIDDVTANLNQLGGSDSGTLIASGVFNGTLGLRIRLEGSSNVVATAMADVSVVSITVGGQTIFVPEPSSIALATIGLAACAMGLHGRRRRTGRDSSVRT